MSEDTSPLDPTCGSGAASSHPSAAASHRWSGPASGIMVGRGRVCGPHPPSGMAAYCCAGAPGARVAAHHGPIRVPTPGPLYEPPTRSWSRAR